MEFKVIQKKYSLVLGIVDKNKPINKRYKYDHGNAVCFTGGTIWYGTGNNGCQSQYMGNGYAEGDVVRV